MQQNTCEKCGEVVVFDQPAARSRKLCPACGSVVSHPDAPEALRERGTSARSFGGWPIESFIAECGCGQRIIAEPGQFREVHNCPNCGKQVRIVGRCLHCHAPSENISYFWKGVVYYVPGDKTGKPIQKSTRHERVSAFICSDCLQKVLRHSLKLRWVALAVWVIVLIASANRRNENPRDDIGAVGKAVGVIVLALPVAVWVGVAYWRAYKHPDPEHEVVQRALVESRNEELRAELNLDPAQFLARSMNTPMVMYFSDGMRKSTEDD